MRVRLRPTCLAAVAAGALLAAPGTAVASTTLAGGAAANLASGTAANLAGDTSTTVVASAAAPQAGGGQPSADTGTSVPVAMAAGPTAPVMPTDSSLVGISIEPRPALLQHSSLRRSSLRRSSLQRSSLQRSAGLDGMMVAAIGTALTVGGWLLILAGGRRLRRRTGRRG